MVLTVVCGPNRKIKIGKHLAIPMMPGLTILQTLNAISGVPKCWILKGRRNHMLGENHSYRVLSLRSHPANYISVRIDFLKLFCGSIIQRDKVLLVQLLFNAVLNLFLGPRNDVGRAIVGLPFHFTDAVSYQKG